MTNSITIRPTRRVLNMQNKSHHRIHCTKCGHTPWRPVSTPEFCGLLSSSSPCPRLFPVFQLTKIPSGIIILRRISQLLCPASICCANIYCNLCEKQRFMITFGNWVVIYIIYMYIYIEDGRAKKDSSSLGTYDGAEGAGINSPGNVTRQQKFSPKLCKVFEFLFVFSLIFFIFFSLVLRFALSLFSTACFSCFWARISKFSDIVASIS